MAETEKKKSELSKRLLFLEAELRKRYNLTDDAGVRFLTEDGRVFFLTGIRDYNAVVVEYAESLAEASVNRFEDGDLFFIDDLPEEEMLSAIISEIEAD